MTHVLVWVLFAAVHEGPIVTSGSQEFSSIETCLIAKVPFERMIEQRSQFSRSSFVVCVPK